MEKVICKICNRELKMISWNHLKIHNLTIKEYKKIYPNQEILSDSIKRGLRFGPISQKGIPRTKEVREKIRKKQIGQHHTPENEFKKGHEVPEEWKEINRKIQTGKKHSKLTKTKQSISRYRWLKNPNNKKKFLESLKESAIKRRKWKMSKKELSNLYWNEKLSIRQIAKKFNTYYSIIYYIFKRENILKRTFKEGIKLNPAKLSDEGRKVLSKKVSKSKKKMWKNPEYRKNMLVNLENARKNITEDSLKKMFKALSIKPNKPEKVIIKIIKENNLLFDYTGDGKIWIEKRCPDFISLDNSKIIELFGRAFHDPNSRRGKVVNIPYHRTEKGTIEHYNKQGYKCLVIWDDELKNLNKVTNKIINFS